MTNRARIRRAAIACAAILTVASCSADSETQIASQPIGSDGLTDAELYLDRTCENRDPGERLGLSYFLEEVTIVTSEVATAMANSASIEGELGYLGTSFDNELFTLSGSRTESMSIELPERLQSILAGVDLPTGSRVAFTHGTINVVRGMIVTFTDGTATVLDDTCEASLTESLAAYVSSTRGSVGQTSDFLDYVEREPAAVQAEITRWLETSDPSVAPWDQRDRNSRSYSEANLPIPVGQDLEAVMAEVEVPSEWRTTDLTLCARGRDAWSDCSRLSQASTLIESPADAEEPDADLPEAGVTGTGVLLPIFVADGEQEIELWILGEDANPGTPIAFLGTVRTDLLVDAFAIAEAAGEPTMHLRVDSATTLTDAAERPIAELTDAVAEISVIE